MDNPVTRALYAYFWTWVLIQVSQRSVLLPRAFDDSAGMDSQSFHYTGETSENSSEDSTYRSGTEPHIKTIKEHPTSLSFSVEVPSGAPVSR